MFLTQLSTPAMDAGTPSAPAILYPTPGLVLEYAEDDINAITTVSWVASPSPSLALSGDDAAAFSLVGDTLVWASQPDYETPTDANADNIYEITVTADNGEGEFSVAFAVQVTNVDDTVPVITFPTDSPVQVPSGRLMAFSGRSVDDAQERAWAITGGVDSGKFTIVQSTGRVSFRDAPDYATPADFDADNDYELTISVTTGGGEDTQDVIVRVVEGGVREPAIKPTVISSIKSTWGGIG